MSFPKNKDDEKYALCIINTYQLKNALNDILVQLPMLLNWGIPMNNIYILTDDDTDPRIRFLRDLVYLNQKINVRFNNGNNFINNYNEILRTIAVRAKTNTSLYISISGHGARTKDLDGDEKDGYDEYIMPNGVKVLDDQLQAGLNNLGSNFYVLGATDTCHSGTMFDLDTKKPLKCQAISISACADKEVDWETGCNTNVVKGFITKNFDQVFASKYLNFIPPIFITGSLTAELIQNCFNGITPEKLISISLMLKNLGQTLYINGSGFDKRSQTSRSETPPPNNSNDTIGIIVGVVVSVVIIIIIFCIYYFYPRTYSYGYGYGYNNRQPVNNITLLEINDFNDMAPQPFPRPVYI